MTNQEIHEAKPWTQMTLDEIFAKDETPVMSGNARTIVESIKLLGAEMQNNPKGLPSDHGATAAATICVLWSLLARCGNSQDTWLAHKEVGGIIVSAISNGGLVNLEGVE